MAKSYKEGTPSSGLPTERLCCPMCGWWRTVNYGVSKITGEIREVRYDKIDIDNALMWRLEKLTGKGRGSHDATIELLDSKTLSELPEDLKNQIRSQCEKILATLGEIV